jgi:cell division protein ZapA
MSEPLIKIRIKIAERDYPMTVTAEQEARLRQAGRVLNERIKLFRTTYGLPDQDVLPMIALEAVADQLLAEQERDAGSAGFHQRLQHLHDLLLTVPTGPGSGGAGDAGIGSDAAAKASGGNRGSSVFTGA